MPATFQDISAFISGTTDKVGTAFSYDTYSAPLTYTSLNDGGIYDRTLNWLYYTGDVSFRQDNRGNLVKSNSNRDGTLPTI